MVKNAGNAVAQGLTSIEVGQAVRFSAACPLAPLTGSMAYVLAVRNYRFGADVLQNFQLQVGRSKHYFLTIAQDEQGQYLSLSRALSEEEQDRWFGRDALGFFTEPSSAKSIRCKVDMGVEGDWAAPRYSKTVDWIEGSVTQAGGGRNARGFHYNLLVSEAGDKALEIEHDDASGENRVFATIYRPIQDIAAIEEVTSIPDVVVAAASAPAAPLPEMPLSVGNVPLFKDYPALSSPPKQRPDFRRQDEVAPAQIHIPRMISTEVEIEEEDLPSFLIAREILGEDNVLTLDEVLAPEPERVRVGLKAARTLIERAMVRQSSVRDVLREMVGLEAEAKEEVIFELPLTDADYRQLGMRFKLRPDHRAEIRARLEDELRRQLAK